MELDVRGTPGWQIREYLVLLGAKEQLDGSYAGPGWTATLTEGEHQAFRMVFPRVVVRLSGDAAAVADIYAKLRLRAMRAGG